eukprot:CAMPEP_0205936330 /NCGR_PEP_ID=MMETSP1325-20131115/41338_1 /ASSEMBLY_ACC=CAM_ASM_000708 /TAXON_ID=236786 /ORGANISM="Florenciella sp., Strain RCC1007" /LENGTH=79 /DNA_ID=CAMNT_0053306483 /DNA_START=78 /DNA_END=317 /DNA_ORIENTATION=-
MAGKDGSPCSRLATSTDLPGVGGETRRILTGGGGVSDPSLSSWSLSCMGERPPSESEAPSDDLFPSPWPSESDDDTQGS